MPLLQIQEVCKRYAEKLANDHISLEVKKQSIYGLLGPNGAGKTTLIRIITQIIGADSGIVIFDGKPLKEWHTAQIGYMPEERGLYRKMKVLEHLVYLARLKDLSSTEAKERVQWWFDRLGMEGWENKRIEELSKGMQQKVQFIATVIHNPKLLILDEPFSGLDPINADLIKNEIYQLRERGTTIIFSTHRMEQVEEICEQIALINDGKKVLEGAVDELKQQFKENKFVVNFQGEITDELRNNLSLISENEHELTLQLKKGQSPNQVLEILMKHGIAITVFKELLPSLNEIFIKQVQAA